MDEYKSVHPGYIYNTACFVVETNEFGEPFLKRVAIVVLLFIHY